MRTHEFIPETMRGFNFDKIAQQAADYNYEKWKSAAHIADIDNYQVHLSPPIYSLWNDNDMVAFFQVLPTDDYAEVDNVWVNQSYQNQKIFSKFLWFLKTRENYSKLLIGNVHSPKMQEIMLGLSRFDKFWYNIETKEKHDFDEEKTDEYYSFVSPTKWQIMLENHGNFDNWPRFTNHIEYIKEDYNWQIS